MSAHRGKATGGHSEKGESTSQGEKPQGTRDWLWTSRLQNYEKINSVL